MLNFLVTLWNEDGGMKYVVYAEAELDAVYQMRKYARNEGTSIEHIEAEEFNTFEHGDIRDYEQVI